MDLKIREAIENDYIDISNFVREVHKLHVKNRPDIYLEVDNPLLKDRFEDLLNSDNTKLFVVEDIYNNELISYSIIQIIHQRNINLLIPSKFIYIDDFCVKSNHQKTGVGKFLFNHIVDYAKSKNISSIHLTVSEFNKKAIKFYETLGMSTRNRKMELSL
ncbi:MAG: GNAT family N-acetyltransferase [Tepidibacter sp.]|jgi:ribosomal protein S18 acetylase RimI-like enzyme|uniref:GNAT family N-acetyltransferase n=1 Tax=Tepidibacter sp. TaxID=2529387 RepID=UPI0025F15CCC|nr:GNAT family N-acetyltransferase [Tepidibacter sp.]MCT4507232.1 GNAT family N-acetyltransferase [Tepidibacter sp.]